MLACLLHGPGQPPAAAAAPLAAAGQTGWTTALLDLSAVPEVGEMLDIAGPESWLLLMRDRVILYRAPVSATTPADFQALVARAAGLDMGRVRADLAEQEMGRQALLNRRACPTTWRRDDSEQA